MYDSKEISAMKPGIMRHLPAITLSCAVLFPCPLRTAELPRSQEVVDMLWHDRFDELEKLTSDLRKEKLEFYAGYSKLSTVYGYLDGPGRKADDSVWKEYISKLEKWAAAYPQSPTPLVALGNTYKDWAWKARGGGYGDTVTRQGWKLFEDRLDNARRYLKSADRLPTKDPEIYHALVTVAMGLGWPREEMEAVFNKGVEIEPNYLQLYHAKAYYLLPRWHGEPGDWEAFAKEAADARGGEEGDILYMAIARSQAWSEGSELFGNTRISYARMKRGFEASLRCHPNYVWEMNSFCYFACIAGDRETAKDHFNKINGRWEKEVWGQQGKFVQWQNWATQNGRAPATAMRGRPTRAPPTSEQIKSALLVTGAIWLGVVVLVAAIVWSIVHNHQKSK
jgi:hypothetical protein